MLASSFKAASVRVSASLAVLFFGFEGERISLVFFERDFHSVRDLLSCFTFPIGPGSDLRRPLGFVPVVHGNPLLLLPQIVGRRPRGGA